jgi:hypothetical protein
MNEQTEQMGEIIVNSSKKRSSRLAIWTPSLLESSGANAGVENILRGRFGWIGNELSTQYAVRGAVYWEFSLC